MPNALVPVYRLHGKDEDLEHLSELAYSLWRRSQNFENRLCLE